MNIYFAGAIRGGRDDAEMYAKLILFLQSQGTVLTEHVGNEDLLQEEQFLTEEEIFNRDIKWLEKADLLIAEVSTPSLGVGYELAAAEKMDIPCLCLFRKNQEITLSAMIHGNPFFQIVSYTSLKEVQKSLSDYLEKFHQTLRNS